MKKIEYVIVHCADSEWGSRAEIDKWHRARGWNGCGYHVVILNGRITPQLLLPPLNGSFELGRSFTETGAHCLGYNDRSIGVCGIAKGSWTESQEISLVILLRELQRQYKFPTANILGHGETDSGKKEGKTCPNLDMARIRDLVDGRRA